MATNRNGKSKTAQSKLSGAELRGAVMASCVEYAERRYCERDGGERAEGPCKVEWDLRGYFDRAGVDAARAACRLLLDGLTAAVDFAGAGHATSGQPARALQRIGTQVAPDLLRQLNREWGEPFSDALRRELVEELDAPWRLWWGGTGNPPGSETPKGRDLAIASLLAGNWPDGLIAGSHTVRQVIEAEERAINHWRLLRREEQEQERDSRETVLKGRHRPKLTADG